MSDNVISDIYRWALVSETRAKSERKFELEGGRVEKVPGGHCHLIASAERDAQAGSEGPG